MSFPRAKLQRFNDIKPCTPSPADYNVPTTIKPKGAVIPQCERFLDLKSPTPSENGSVKSTPCFRTPTLPKGKKPKPPTTTTPKQLFEAPINHYLEALNEKIVECENKDLFIKDLTDQMEELKQQMSTLETNFREIEQKNYEEKLKELNKQFDESKQQLNIEYNNKIDSLNIEKEKLNEELNNLKTKYNELKMLDETVRKDLSSKEVEVRALEEECVIIQEKHAAIIENMEKKHMHEIQDIEFEMLKTMTELEKEKQNAANKIQDIEHCMQEEISRLTASFQNEREHFYKESENKMKQLEDDLRAETASVMKEMNEKLRQTEIDWKLKLENQEKESEQILKECQAISEYNIIQCELEKNHIKSDLTEKSKQLNELQKKYGHLTASYEDLQEKYKQIQKNYSELIIEVNEVRKQLSETINDKENEIKRLLSEKRTFEITITTSQDTIEVLKRRLINSDTDVEQFKAELALNEQKMIEYESKQIQLLEELRLQQLLNDEMEMQYESMIKLNEKQIQEVKEELTKKVEGYRNEVVKYSKKLNDDQELFSELLEQLREQRNVNQDAFKLINVVKAEIEQLQHEIQEYCTKEKQWKSSEEQLHVEKSQLEEQLTLKEDELCNMLKQIGQLQEKCDSYCQHFEYYKSKVLECEREIEEADNIHKKYIDQSGKYDNLLQKYEQLESENGQYKHKLEEANCKLLQQNEFKQNYEELLKKFKLLEAENQVNKNKIVEQNNLVSPFKRQLEAYEFEREKLIDEKLLMEKEAKEMSQKYADIVGHQNTKQKIKHMVDIKMKNEELIQCKLELEAKVRAQSKMIEKLRNENADLKRGSRKFGKAFVDDKENIRSPNRSLNNSFKIDSPGPLKERN